MECIKYEESRRELTEAENYLNTQTMSKKLQRKYGKK